MKRLALAIAGVALMTNVLAKTETKTADYTIGENHFKGVVAMDTAKQGKRPGVLVIPEWWGVNDYATSRATMLSDLGYVAFVADMYGEGRSTKDPSQAGKWSGEVKGDRELMRQRANAALQQLKAIPQVDTAQTAAIGYCFGGTAVLEMARSNSDVLGVVSFHGGLDKGNAPTAAVIKPKVLVLHGADDPSVPDKMLANFKDELDNAKADWYLTSYGHAVHAFTNPNSGNAPSKGVAYNEKADKRSWIAMKDFFAEIFKH